MDLSQTPLSQMHLSSEVRNVIMERNLLTTKTRMKVLSALKDISLESSESKESLLRAKAINEILTSEATYLHHLELIMKYFMEPIGKRKYISEDDYTAIFGNIETIYHVNGELLNELKTNKENIAAAFLKLAPFLKLYSVFAYDYQRGLNLLETLQKKLPSLDELIKNQESRPEVSTKLVSLLITPIQRIPRYCLLLKEVISHTPSSHPDFIVLQESFQQVESSARHMDSLMQVQENMEKMIALQKSLFKGKPEIIAPGRQFIKAGKLMKVSRRWRKVLPRYFVLLNDMLLCCKLLSSDPTTSNSLTCVCVLPLKKCEVQWVMGKAIFKVSCINENFVLYSSSNEESESWVNALTEAVRQFQECRKTLRKGSSSKRPLRGSAINNLWQNSPKLDLGKKRPYHEDNETGNYCNEPDENSKENHCVSHCIRKLDESSPSKMRKMEKGKTSTLMNITNKPPDSLFPMRLEFNCSNDSPRTSENELNNEKLEDNVLTGMTSSKLKSQQYKRKCRTMKGRATLNAQFNSEEIIEKDSSSENNNLWNKSFRHSSSFEDKSQVRNSWHNRCYRLVRSFSVNVHQSFRRGMKIFSRHPQSDSN